MRIRLILPVLILVLVMSVGLSSCVSEDTVTAMDAKIAELESKISANESKILELEEKIAEYEKADDGENGTDGLEYYRLPDGTYGVIAGDARYLEEIVIPESYNGKPVTKILSRAFEYAENLKKITIPSGVSAIGDFAFANCSNLKNVTIPDSVTTISDSAFENSPIESATIPAVAVSAIKKSQETNNGNTSFVNNTLKSIIITSGENIKDWVLSECKSLEIIVISTSVTSIGEYAFWRCTSLASIKYRGTQEEWDAILKGDYWDGYTGNYTIICNYTGE